MLRIEDTIFSFDILDQMFRCNLPMCKGSCCRYGDSGATLSEAEVVTLKEIWPKVKMYIRPEGVAEIEKNGTSVVDFENDNVTPLINNKECAYTIIKDNIYMCGIEKAWIDGRVSFQKPVSCHLFPAKIKYYKDYRTVNYQELAICSQARKTGIKEGVYVYRFLKEPLTRLLGKDLYDELCIAADEIKRNNRITR